jgi:5,10-methylenetetrahydromethanopterin reductase
VKVVAALPVSTTDDVDAARAEAAQQFAMYPHPPYRAMLDREGYTSPEDAALVGDESQISARLDELKAAGVDEFVAIAFDRSEQGRTRSRAAVRAWVATDD